jgi:hypothetical protein
MPAPRVAFSVWEVAHRWHGHDPNTTDPKALPQEVQEALRLLTKLMADCELSSASAGGVENWVSREMATYRDFRRFIGDQGRLYVSEKADADLAAWEAKLARHKQAIAGLERCFRDGVYDKAKLSRVYVLPTTLLEVCERQGLQPPAFLSDPGAVAIVHTNKPGELIKRDVQAAARKLWAQHPDMTIREIIQHRDVQIGASARPYSDKYLREWIKEVDPRPPALKRGRPKKRPPKTE